MIKWSSHKVGGVQWINDRLERLSNCHYISHVRKSKPQSIVEIGGGELIEAQKIRGFTDIPYHVVDVSKTFLENARKHNFKTFEASMDKLPFKDKEYDLLYMNGVLEHTPNLKKTILEIERVAKRYYITLFKWRLLYGGLKEDYCDRRRYYSSCFNVFQLLDLFGHSVKKMLVSDINNNLTKWKAHLKKYKISGKYYISTHRDGHHLHIIGKW